MPRLIRLMALMIMAALALSLIYGRSTRPATPPQGDSQSAAQEPAGQKGAGGAHVADAGKPDIDDAARRGLPAVIKLGSDTCDPCRRMKPVMEELARQYGGKVVFLTVDVYKHTDLASTYRVQVIPKIIFVDRAGKAVAYIEGYQTVAQMKSLIEKSGILK